MKRLLFIIVGIPAMLSGCNKAELVDIVAMGWTEKTITVSERVTDGSAQLLTNTPYSARVCDGNDWLSIPAEGMMPSARKDIPFHCDANRNFKRTGKIVISAGTRVDTLCIRQSGALQDRISLSVATISAPQSGGTFYTAVECFRYPDALFLDVSAPNALQATYSDGILEITVAPSTSRDPKTYSVMIYYIDGWGERASATVTINQDARN